MSMMALGDFRFSLRPVTIGTKIEPYEELTRRSGYEWTEQTLIGRDPAVQYTGNTAEVMTLRGRIFPYYKGGLGQLDQMRISAGNGVSHQMIDGRGSVLGDWAIISIQEVQKYHFDDGSPRYIDFSVELKRIAASG